MKRLEVGQCHRCELRAGRAKDHIALVGCGEKAIIVDPSDAFTHHRCHLSAVPEDESVPGIRVTADCGKCTVG